MRFSRESTAGLEQSEATGPARPGSVLREKSGINIGILNKKLRLIP